MELTNEFTVDVPVDTAWAVLTDLQRIAPCMPGAQLQEVDGDDYLGVVRVKVGPVTAEYRGKAHFLERDAAAHKAVLRAEGRETRGQGNASATISAQLESSGSATKVAVVTDLSISGRVAQFGRGVLADVSNKLLGQFVQQLESTVLAEGEGATGEGTAATAGAPPSSGAGAPAPAAPAAGGEEGPAPGAGGAADESPVAEAPLATEARADGEGTTADEASAAVNGHRAADSWATSGAGPEPAPVNLLRVVGPVILKRALPPALLVALFVFWRRLRHRARG